MSHIDTVQLVALVGWLILASSALVSLRLNWSKALRLCLIWFSIFMGVFLLFDIVRGV